MKILLCSPSMKNSGGGIIKARKIWITGLTLPYLAAITPKGVEVEIANELVDELDFKGDYDMVGITSMGGSITRAFEIADRFRENGTKVVMGGISVTNNYTDALEHCDSVVKGEAELVWEGLLDDLRKDSLKRIYEADRFCDISDIPTPRYDLLDKNKIGPIMSVQASRGCTQKCKFCSMVPIYNGNLRTRKIDSVLRDIEAVKKLGYKRFYFVDDNFTGNKIFAKKLIKALIPLKIKWSAQSSLTALYDGEMVDYMAQSGCEMLSIGFETINPQTLKSINKHSNTVDNYKKIVMNLKRKGIHTNAFFMFGFDEDDKTIFDSTLDFIIDAGISLPELFILAPAPGTQLFDEFKRDGRLLHTDWSRYTSGEVVYRPKKMTPEELQEGYWKIYERIYSLPSIFKRLFLKGAGKKAWLNFLIFGLNLRYRKFVVNRGSAEYSGQSTWVG